MSKIKSTILFCIVCVLMACLALITFVRFPVGINDFKSVLGAIELDYDMQGGVSYTLTLADDNETEVEDVNVVLSKLSVRMEALGYQNYTITALNDMAEGVEDYEIRITTKNTASIASDISTVARYGKVKFFFGTASNPTDEIMNEEVAIADSTYTGSFVDQDGSTKHGVEIKFSDYGYQALNEAMDNADGSTYYLKITLGEQELLNSEIKKDTLSGKTVYISTSSADQAKQMALQLKTGGLEYKYTVSAGETIGAIFGDNTALISVIAIVSMIVVAMALFFVKFKGYGFIASLSLLFFILVETAMMIAVPGIVMSLTGVLGIILATVVCVDGLIMVVKRIAEEYAVGKTVKASVKTGFKRSLFPTINTNVLALIVGLLLFAFTSGYIRTFAITFSIGIGVSFITTVLIARLFTVLLSSMVNDPEKFLSLERSGN